MRRTFLFLLCLFCVLSFSAQELNCLVTVNSEQIRGSNRQVFETLQTALTEFVNQTKWTTRSVKPEERINCAMNIIVTSRNDNRFEASIQVQSTRPVYNTSYSTPILNLKDNDFSFTYNEFDPLIYNRNTFDSNLISTIVFYVYTIIGLDADTFSKYGGTNALKEAENVMLQAQQSGIESWQNVVGKQNRFLLISNLLSEDLNTYRTVLYDYHIQGLDNFSTNNKFAKQKIEDTVMNLERIFNKSVANYLIRVFFDAKADEIIQIYSDGPKTRNPVKLANTLQKISPTNNNKWRDIK